MYDVAHFGDFLWFELPAFEGYAELEGFQCGGWRDNQKNKKQNQEQLLRNLNLTTEIVWVGEKLSSVICRAKEEAISFSLESNTVSSRPV